MTTPLEIDPALFRQLLSRFATGVSVITTRNELGEPVGMTASSLASVSLNPPLVSVCVDVTAETHRALLTSGTFVINILAAQQEAISSHFALTPTEARFTGVAWEASPEGHVLLRNTLAHITCERYADFPLGDHTLFVGRVIGGATASGEPLLYYRGQYGSFQP